LKRTALTLTLVTVLLSSAIAGTLLVKPVSARTITVPDDYSTVQGAIDAANDGDKTRAIGVAIAIVVIGAGLGFLICLIKRK
jgi:hypothetical protein